MSLIDKGINLVSVSIPKIFPNNSSGRTSACSDGKRVFVANAD